MEFQFPSFQFFFHFPLFPSSLTFLIFVLMVLKLAKRSKHNKQSPKLPPGPRKLPLIGNMHQLVGSLPHQFLRDLARKHGPLMHLQLGELSVVAVSSAEIAKEVMKTNDIVFAGRPCTLVGEIVLYNSKDIILAPYGDYWRQLRKICTLELLSTKRVQSFKSIREQEVSNLIRFISISGGSSINLSEILISVTYSIIIRVAIGKKNKDHEALIILIKELAESSDGFWVGDLFPSVKILPTITGQRSKYEKLHHAADRILDGILDEHKARRKAVKTAESQGDEDLVDVLLRVQESGELEFLSLLKTSKLLSWSDVLSAGSETSSTVVEWGMSESLKTERVMEKAQEEVRQVCNRKANVDETDLHELKYLKLVIKETMRLHPSLPLLIARECREKCQINRYEIPVKAKVFVNAWALGRNPDYWVDAESFVPEQFVDSSIDYSGTYFEYIHFGSGRRICPGISFGLANVELPLAQLLFHFDWKLAEGIKNEDLDMTEDFGVTCRRKNDLRVIFTAHLLAEKSRNR